MHMKEQTHQARKLTADERADLLRRGLAAWFTTPGAQTTGPDGHPVAARLATLKDETNPGHLLHFVLIDAGPDMLVVYRVRNDNLMLRRMRRPPKRLK